MQSHAISCLIFFFFHDTATTEIYTLSLHDALPISIQLVRRPPAAADLAVFTLEEVAHWPHARVRVVDRKSTRLNSSHPSISYAVFCLKKKKKTIQANEVIHIVLNSYTL